MHEDLSYLCKACPCIHTKKLPTSIFFLPLLRTDHFPSHNIWVCSDQPRRHHEAVHWDLSLQGPGQIDLSVTIPRNSLMGTWTHVHMEELPSLQIRRSLGTVSWCFRCSHSHFCSQTWHCTLQQNKSCFVKVLFPTSALQLSLGLSRLAHRTVNPQFPHLGTTEATLCISAVCCGALHKELLQFGGNLHNAPSLPMDLWMNNFFVSPCTKWLDCNQNYPQVCTCWESLKKLSRC